MKKGERESSSGWGWEGGVAGVEDGDDTAEGLKRGWIDPGK